MPTCLVDCPGGSWSYYNYFSNTDLLIFNIQENQCVRSVTLWAAKFTNYGYPLTWTDGSGTYVPPGRTTSTNNVTLRIKINGTYSHETHTITGSVPMVGGNTHITSWAPTNDSYVFTFDDIPVYPNQHIVCEFTGVGNGYTTGVTMYRSGYGSQGLAEILDIPQGPNSISVSPSSDWITDLSGATENNNQGVLKDYTTNLQLLPNPNTAKLSNIEFSSSNLIRCNFNSDNNIISVTALNNNIDYPSNDTITVTTNNNVSTDFSINFYEKPKVDFSTTSTNIKINIRTAALNNEGYAISGYNPITINSASDRALFMDDTYMRSFSPQNNNSLLNIGQYLNNESDSNNLFKIAEEGLQHKLKFRFFNHYVQTNLSEIGTYKKDLIAYVTWYITPTLINQFSFDWIDNDNNIIDEAPSIIMPDFNSPVIGNLRYTNEAIVGGYCRGFRIEYLNDSNTVLKTDYLNATIDQNGMANYDGKAILNVNNLPYNELITIKITMYYYFNSDSTVRYFGASYILNQKLLRIDESALYPIRVFPIVSETSPYTPMMLEDVERFGYELSDFMLYLNNNNIMNFNFGLLVDGLDIADLANAVYSSSSMVTKHIVFDVGKFVKDNKLYKTELTVLPYIDIIYSEHEKRRIMLDDIPNYQSPNAVINTSTDTMWYRPIVNKGEYVTYFDYDRFMQFINKYRPLVNNQIFEVPTRKTGEIINTDFWIDKANRLSVYAENMQNWATDVTNFVVLWAMPEFEHKKGEIITNDNLYQNYYDLLVQHSGYFSFTSHDYLNENSYTHNELNKFTHNQITNKRDLEDSRGE